MRSWQRAFSPTKVNWTGYWFPMLLFPHRSFKIWRNGSSGHWSLCLSSVQLIRCSWFAHKPLFNLLLLLIVFLLALSYVLWHSKHPHPHLSQCQIFQFLMIFRSVFSLFNQSKKSYGTWHIHQLSRSLSPPKYNSSSWDQQKELSEAELYLIFGCPWQPLLLLSWF